MAATFQELGGLKKRIFSTAFDKKVFVR